MWVFTVAATLLPSLAILWHFVKKDRYPEPTNVIVKTFFLGWAITIPVVLLALILASVVPQHGSIWLRGTMEAFLGAAIPEELLKLAVVYLYCMRHSAFDEPMDGIVYGVTVSLGFATFENILYVLDGGLSVAIARALTAIPGHAFVGTIMGYYCGIASHARGEDRSNALWLAFLIPTLLHGFYDAPLLALSLSTSGEGAVQTMIFVLAVMIVSFLLALRAHRRFVRMQSRAC